MEVPLLEGLPGSEVEVPRNLVHLEEPVDVAPLALLLLQLGAVPLPLALLDPLEVPERPAPRPVALPDVVARVAAVPGLLLGAVARAAVRSVLVDVNLRSRRGSGDVTSSSTVAVQAPRNFSSRRSESEAG